MTVSKCVFQRIGPGFQLQDNTAGLKDMPLVSSSIEIASDKVSNNVPSSAALLAAAAAAAAACDCHLETLASTISPFLSPGV